MVRPKLPHEVAADEQALQYIRAIAMGVGEFDHIKLANAVHRHGYSLRHASDKGQVVWGLKDGESFYFKVKGSIAKCMWWLISEVTKESNDAT